MSEGAKNKLIAIAAVVVLLFAAGTFFDSQRNRPLNTAPEYTPSDAPATIGNAEELYKAMGSDRAFRQLQQDVTTFGQLAVKEAIATPGRQLQFSVTSAVTSTDNTVSFEGMFNGSQDALRIEVNLLQNDRIKVSITNLRNNGNIDSRLPSNNKQNQFIGSLPYRTDSYKIEYNSSVNSFTITALRAGSDVRGQAYDYITSNMGLPRESLKILYKPHLF